MTGGTERDQTGQIVICPPAPPTQIAAAKGVAPAPAASVVAHPQLAFGAFYATFRYPLRATDWTAGGSAGTWTRRGEKGARDERIVLRCTWQEKSQLEDAASRQGLSVSDFTRFAIRVVLTGDFAQPITTGETA